MGKLLKVLVIIFLLLSVAALVLGIMLFAKRELLKGRTQKLETTVIALGPTIEAKPAGPQEISYPARDISPCTEEILDSPERSDFWSRYSSQLELQDQPKLDLASRRNQLMMYFNRDPQTGKVQRDQYGRKLTTGEGTMQAVLDELLSTAQNQYNRLNETRQQLANVRAELVDTISDLNTKKSALRVALKTIKDLRAEIEDLKKQIASLKETIAQLEEAKRVLEEKVAEQQRQIAQLEEEKGNLEAQNTQLKKENDDFRKGAHIPAGGGLPSPLQVTIEPGEKGKVVAVNPKWNFVVLELSDDFLHEILGKDLSETPPNVDLLINRKDDPQKFVTKVRLIQVRKKDKLGIADILLDWQQLPVEESDLVLY